MAEPPASERKYPWLTSPCRGRIGTLSLAGSLKDTPGIQSNSMRVLGSYAIILITEGEGYYSDGNGARAELRPGDAVVAFPDLAHAYGPREDGRWTQCYVVFDGPCFDLMRQEAALDPKRPVWHLEPVDYWRRRLEEIVHGAAGKGETGALRAVGRFVALLAEMAATDREASRSQTYDWLDTSAHLLSEPQIDGWLTPQAAAERVGLSYENFRKLFAQEIGEAPGQFQKRRRIERACAAIYQNGASFKQLAEELGFCDVYHFSRVFRQVVGETPSAFRRRVRGA